MLGGNPAEPQHSFSPSHQFHQFRQSYVSRRVMSLVRSAAHVEVPRCTGHSGPESARWGIPRFCRDSPPCLPGLFSVHTAKAVPCRSAQMRPPRSQLGTLVASGGIGRERIARTVQSRPQWVPAHRASVSLAPGCPAGTNGMTLCTLISLPRFPIGFGGCPWL